MNQVPVVNDVTLTSTEKLWHLAIFPHRWDFDIKGCACGVSVNKLTAIHTKVIVII